MLHIRRGKFVYEYCLGSSFGNSTHVFRVEKRVRIGVVVTVFRKQSDTPGPAGKKCIKKNESHRIESKHFMEHDEDLKSEFALPPTRTSR